MADKSISVSLDFTANTNQAESALKSLQTSLQSISNMSTIGQDARMAKNIEEASAAAMTLRNNLQAAFDQKTGSLNLSKLNEEMAKSGMSAEKYRTTLSAIGPQGRQAFMELANAVVASQTPLKQTSGLVDKLWDSLKRTAGWQLSSTVIHGFMGAIQSAYGYAQDLNQSLNNIRIVTGASTDEMARFADKANKAAKALSSTTTDYTDAALIYYQQGIRDENEIAGRTDTTIKLANVSRQSAEEVSSQMTAIWNNFDDGSHSLEYYADVITKLGATTAASSSEIAGGMEKFAAVADTVGLSYEYAAASLATIVATTRQSEDTVGTGLRTIFSRLEGLKLGDTLEDGTDLNKYSKALETVGVNIKDASGNLKDMDTILDETAAKWDTLDQAQKVAFATTVGGVRQYTNLIALLDNWEMMEENVATARGSEGALQEQQDIYAESWEAASKRVRAAAESIYDDLLNDDFFIELNNLFAGILETVDKLIDAFGGLGGVLPLIFTLVNKIFGEKIQAGAQRLAENIYYSTSTGKAERKKQDQETKESFITETQNMAKTGVGSQQGEAAAAGYSKIAALQMELVKNAKNLTEEEQNAYRMSIERLTVLTEQAAELGKQADQLASIRNSERLDVVVGAENEDAHEAYAEKMQNGTMNSTLNTLTNGGNNLDNNIAGLSSVQPLIETMEQLTQAEQGSITTAGQLQEAFNGLNEVQQQFTGNMQTDLSTFEQYHTQVGQLQSTIDRLNQSESAIDDNLQPGTEAFQQAKEVLTQFKQEAAELGVKVNIRPGAIKTVDGLKNAYAKLTASIKVAQQTAGKNGKQMGDIMERMYKTSGMKDYGKKVQEAAKAQQQATKATNGLKNATNGLPQAFNNAGAVAVTTSQKIQAAIAVASRIGQIATSASMAISSFKGLKDAFTAPDMSPWERVSSVFMSLGMLIPSVIGTVNQLAGVWRTLQAVTILNNTALVAQKAKIDANNVAQIKNIAVTKGLTMAEATEEAVKKGLITAEQAKILLSGKATIADVAQTVAQGALNIAMGIGTAVTTAFTDALIALYIALGPIVAPIVLIIGAVGLLAGAVALFSKAVEDNKIEEENTRMQEAADSVNQLSEAYNKAKTSAEEFREACKGYEDIKDGIDKATMTMDEYSAAVEEANEKARELIETYGLWDAVDGYDENGVIKFKEGALEEAQAQKDAAVQDSHAKLVAAQVYQDTTNNDIKADRIVRENDLDYSSDEAVDRGNLKAYANFIKKAQEDGKDISDASVLKGLEGFSDLPTYVQNNIESYIKVNDAALKLADSLDTAASKANYYDEQMTRDVVEEKHGEEYAEASNGDKQKENAALDAAAAIASRAQKERGDSYSQKVKEYTKNLDEVETTGEAQDRLEEITGDSKRYESGGDRDIHNDEELALTYAQMKAEAEGKTLDRDSLTYKGDDKGNGHGAVMDADGNYIVGSEGQGMDDVAMRHEIIKMAAAEQAKEELGKDTSVEDADAIVKEIMSKGSENKTGADVTSALLQAASEGDGGTLDMSSVIGNINEEQLVQLQEQASTMSDADIANMLGLTPEALAAMGYKNAEEFGKAFKEGIQDIDMEEVVASEMDKIRSKAEKEGFDADEVQAYTESLKDLYPNLANNTKAAGDMAIAMMKADRGFQSLGKNFADYKKNLDASKRGTVEWSKSLTSFSKDLSDILGSDITREFAQNIAEDTEMMSLLERGINGDKEAMAQFQAQVAAKTILGVDFDTDGIDAKEQHVLDIVNELTSQDVEIGASLDTTGMTDSFNELIAAGQATSQQISDALAQAGYSPQITYKEISIDDAAAMSQTGYVEVVDDVGPPPHTSMVAIDSLSDVASNNMVKVPVIDGKGTTYTGGAKSAAGAGSKGGGGGGGGGGGSQKKKEAPKADRGARYHGINRRQSNNSRQQTENNRRKDRAFGKAAVELAREDLEIQKKKIELQEEYTKEISKNLKDDREEMKKQFEALQLPINFKFDEDGEIENYQEIIDALFEKEKALVEQYNSGGLDDEAFDEAKKKLDEAKEALGNYEETLELQKDELQTLAEYMEELSDKALELTEIKFELNMSIIEDQLEWLDYSLEKLEDDAYGAAKAIGLMGQQTAQYLKQSEIAQNAINEILGRHGINSIEQLNGLTDSQIEALGFNKDEIEALKDYRSKLYESNQALLEMRRTMTDRVIDTFDTFNEKVQESYEEFDKYNDILEKYNDIVDLLGIKTDSATKRLIKTLRETQLQNLRNQSTSAKEIYEGAVANYDLAKKQYEDAVTRYGATSIQAQQAEEIMKNAQEAMEEGYSNWLDAYQAALEKANEIYEEAMEEIAKDFEASLTNIYGTFDLFDAAYERAKELKDDYLPEYEKIYELNKLNRDIQKEIDNSSSLRDKKALRQLQDEINRKQEAGVQLSKYEVEEMRKKFELEQARMNLEDARNNKSEVRLTRDQNGNWGYVYTAAEDKVADAEQKYEDALYQYQKLSDDYITDLDEKIKDLTKNTQERLDEVREALEEGLIDIDQAEQQKQDILNSFYTQQSYLVSQFKGATDSLASSLGLMDELYGQQAELVDTLPETTFGQVSSVGSMEEWAAKSSEGILKYAEESAKAYERLQTTNQEIADQNKLNLSDIETATNNVAKSSEETQQKVSETVQALADSFKSTMGALATWDQTYAATIQSAIAQNDLFITSLNNVIAKLGLIATYEMKDLYDYIDYLSAKGAKGETITEAEWKKLDEIRQKYATNYSKESMAPFDTGGYTGEWGDEGKIAILHEKEYVLNADLTARFFDALKTFSLVDQFVNTENQIQQQQLQIETLEALSNYIDQLADRMNTTTINPNDFSASLFNSGNQQLEQNVHIEANFPNVTQSSEIEMAFDNLVNKASQYINRKNMSSMTFQDSYLSPV